MNLHEYQAKQFFAEYGIPIPNGRVARGVEEAVAVARELGGAGWVVKSQVHAGGRGKAGGIQRAYSPEEMAAVAGRLLGSHLVTPQTGPAGLPVHAVLIEPLADLASELYLGMVIDRARKRVVVMASSAGGMDIEEVAASHPEKLLTVTVDPIAGLQPYQCRQIGFGLGLALPQIASLSQIMTGLYRLFTEKDASLVEINPLVVTAQGNLLAIDAKLNIDDNALYRHPALAALRDVSQEDEKETIAREYDLNYITLDGNIACMVNGAGLAMATMDLIKLHGGDPANFLDVGGGTTAAKVAEAFKLILSDAKVKAVLVNIFGGIVRCDLIAEGIIKAVQEVGVTIPVVVRLEGTNASQGREMLRNSGLSIIAAEGLDDAARKVVAAVV
ncbi:MAG: ADP-forming succinate--CoA ligase subunit beta [Pseudomonadota bacterium]